TVGLDLAAHGGEQRGLAGAVAADHAHPPAGVQGQVDVGQEQAFAAAEGEIAKGDHRHSLPGCTPAAACGNVGKAPSGRAAGNLRMAIKLSTQVAAWLHSQVVAGAGFEQVQPVLARQGFNEVEVRQVYNAVLR